MTQQISLSALPLLFSLKQIALDQGNREVRNITLLFTPTQEGYRKSLLPPHKHSSKQIFAFQGVMQRTLTALPPPLETANELLKEGILSLILMNSATHRQCLDLKQEELAVTSLGERFSHYRERGLNLGCALSNASLLFINHAFCSSFIHHPILTRRRELASLLFKLRPLLNSSLVEKIIEHTEES